MQKFTIFILCTALLSSCTGSSSIDTPTTGTSGSTTYKQDIASVSDKIKNSEEFNECMKEHATMCIQSVGMGIAQKNKDANFCKELSGKDQQMSCEFAIAMVNAQEQKSDKPCDVLTDNHYAQQCKIQVYKQEATSEKDIGVCDKIDILMQTASGSHENGSEKDQCILQYIMNTSNSKGIDCEKILDESSLAMCKIYIKNRDKDSSIVPSSQK